MFDFLQTIFHKVATLFVASVIGVTSFFTSAPETTIHSPQPIVAQEEVMQPHENIEKETVQKAQAKEVQLGTTEDKKLKELENELDQEKEKRAELERAVSQMQFLQQQIQQNTASLVQPVLSDKPKTVSVQLTSTATSEGKEVERGKEIQIGDFTVTNNTNETLYLNKVFINAEGDGLKKGTIMPMKLSISGMSLDMACHPDTKVLASWPELEVGKCTIEFGIPFAYKENFSVAPNQQRVFVLYADTDLAQLPIQYFSSKIPSIKAYINTPQDLDLVPMSVSDGFKFPFMVGNINIP